MQSLLYVCLELHLYWRAQPIFTCSQATVAGTIIGVEAFLNRDTRDSLTGAERSYLHDSFKYTGGGLVLTALAARGMFKAGLPHRIMSANPCEHIGRGLKLCY
jgi:growth hormone-inducible transmembrane protein